MFSLNSADPGGGGKEDEDEEDDDEEDDDEEDEEEKVSPVNSINLSDFDVGIPVTEAIVGCVNFCFSVTLFLGLKSIIS